MNLAVGITLNVPCNFLQEMHLFRGKVGKNKEMWPLYSAKCQCNCYFIENYNYRETNSCFYVYEYKNYSKVLLNGKLQLNCPMKF